MSGHFHKAAIKCIQSNKTQAEGFYCVNIMVICSLWGRELSNEHTWWLPEQIEPDTSHSEGNRKHGTKSHLFERVPHMHTHPHKN